MQHMQAHVSASILDHRLDVAVATPFHPRLHEQLVHQHIVQAWQQSAARPLCVRRHKDGRLAVRRPCDGLKPRHPEKKKKKLEATNGSSKRTSHSEQSTVAYIYKLVVFNVCV
jgi:hypothetical protein